MSPEQVRGKDLDGRSDLFSFGLVHPVPSRDDRWICFVRQSAEAEWLLTLK